MGVLDPRAGIQCLNTCIYVITAHVKTSRETTTETIQTWLQLLIDL